MSAFAYAFPIDAGFAGFGRVATLIFGFRGLNAVHRCYGSDVRTDECFNVVDCSPPSLAALHVS